MYQQTVEAIAKCNILRANVRIRYEDDLQSDEVTISDLGQVSDEKLRCLKAAVHPFYILTITDQKQQAAFYDYSRRADRPGEKAGALEWVRAKGLIAKLPAYDGEQKLTDFAEELEAACGLELGSALTVIGQFLNVHPKFVRSHSVNTLAAPLECLMNLYYASDATEYGVKLGFIGSETLAKEKK